MRSGFRRVKYTHRDTGRRRALNENYYHLGSTRPPPMLRPHERRARYLATITLSIKSYLAPRVRGRIRVKRSSSRIQRLATRDQTPTVSKADDKVSEGSAKPPRDDRGLGHIIRSLPTSNTQAMRATRRQRQHEGRQSSVSVDTHGKGRQSNPQRRALRAYLRAF